MEYKRLSSYHKNRLIKLGKNPNNFVLIKDNSNFFTVYDKKNNFKHNISYTK